MNVLRYGPPLPFDEQGDLNSRNIHFVLNYFEGYIRFLEDCLDKEGGYIREIYDNDGFWSDNRSMLDTHLKALDYYFPNLLRQSLFVATFSVVETGLVDICEDVQKLRNIRSLGDSMKENGRGNTLKKIRHYLVREAGVRADHLVGWQELCDYSKLRNCIVHRQGHLKEDDEYLRNQYLPNQSFLYVKNGEVRLLKGFCQEVIENVRTFFDQLTAAISANRS